MEQLYENLKDQDLDIANALAAELKRQEDGLELIASENYASKAVIQTMGSVLTNKYAEGLPGKRYYGGCEHVDSAEIIAIDRAKKLFNAEFANVQPHSGANANLAVYFAALNAGDTILGMDLSNGGHLTHGSPVNFSGKLYQAISYGVDPINHRIDFDHVRKQAKEHRPKLIVAGASAYPRTIDFNEFKSIANEIDAELFVDMAHIAGLVATGDHPSPVGIADYITTTTHKTLRGPRGGLILSNEKHAKKLNSAVFPGSQGGPLMHIIAAKAVAFKEAMTQEFKEYQSQVIINANCLAQELLSQGLELVSKGTDNHLMLVDLSNRDLTGKLAEKSLDLASITVNKNTVPNEKRSPFVTSGIRIGVPAITTRGMKQNEMKLIGGWISQVISDPENSETLQKISQSVKELCQSFPVYR